MHNESEILQQSSNPLSKAELNHTSQPMNNEAAPLKLHQAMEVLDIVPVGICITDPSQEDNPIVYVNRTLAEITGYSEAEMVGRNCRFLQGPASDPASVARIRKGLEEGRPVQAVLQNHRKDGETFFNELRIFPMRDEKGSIYRFFGVQHDVTLREEALREAERSRLFAEASIASIDIHTAVVELESGVIRMSPSFAALTRGMGTISTMQDFVNQLESYARADLLQALKDLVSCRKVVTLVGANGPCECVVGVSPIQKPNGASPTQACLVAMPVSVCSNSEAST